MHASRSQNMPLPPVKASGSLDPKPAWARVLARDPEARFVYAVNTTGIFCRPACPSRRPAPKNVSFYNSAAEALVQGFRPCLRCRPLAPAGKQDSAFIQQVCDYLLQHLDRAVTLEQLGQLTGMKPMTLQRKFHQLLNMTPRQFQMTRRASGFRRIVADQSESSRPASITAALYEAGYSAGSRLYSGAQQTLGMTPARFRDGGRGETIVFVTAPCRLGHILVAATGVGICSVTLGDSAEALEAELRRRFQFADSLEKSAARSGQTSLLQQAVETVLSQLTDHPVCSSLPLDLRATVFQQRVWQALAAIPRGNTKSYLEVARDLGQPTASRAVARACASNPVALLIPCHRVVGTGGSLTGYRWGTQRKQALLALEKRQKR